MLVTTINLFVRKHIKAIEMAGVITRIASFSLVSWLGPHSPFMFVWVANTTDAVALTWCASLKRDRAHTLLNAFWIIIGVVEIARASCLFT